MKTITKIEIARLPVRKKVAAYARISEETDRLRHSLSAQISYYNKYIQNNPEWEFVEIYADSGISGTSIKKRKEFLRMIRDCEEGKIDLILTKSIQRFARNTVDLLQTVRHLKSLGVEVRFEKENISTFSGEGEVMLSILASFAQEESRSISENVKWGIRKRFEKGIHNGRFHIFGYRWKGQELVIHEEEASIVRLIYDNYLKGISAEKTAKQLNQMGIKSMKGLEFKGYSVRHILKNITYTGDLLFQKEFKPFCETSRLNKGELPKYLVTDNHEAIISKEVFEEVQRIRLKKREQGVFANKSIKTSTFTTKIRCPHCNKNFRRTRAKYWSCANLRDGKGADCKTKLIPELALKIKAAEVLGLEEFDDEVFLERVDHIDVIEDKKFIFYLTNGEVVETPYIRLEKKKYYELRKDERINKLKARKKDSIFPHVIECGECGKFISARGIYFYCHAAIKLPELKELTDGIENIHQLVLEKDVLKIVLENGEIIERRRK